MNPERQPVGQAAGGDELHELRAEIARLHAEAHRNAELFSRSLERELALLEQESLPQLLQAIVGGLRQSHGLESVTLALQDPEHEIRQLLLGDGHRPEEFAGVLFVDSVVALAPQARSLARPWLGPYKLADHALLFPGEASLGSIALLPLERGGRLVGMINFGSADPARFSSQLASDFLARLGAIAAFALDSACNRARLLRAGLGDCLTGWHNKRYLHSRLREEVARAQRSGGPLSLLMIDLDHFKEVNDSHGHLGGDTAIREVALRVESVLRQSDAAARFGGDEFAIVLPGAGEAAALRAAQRMRRAVSASPVEVGPGVELHVTVSIGVASLVAADAGDIKTQADRLIADADAALYRAKAAGRNQVASAK